MELLALGLMGTAILISAKDIYESRPGAWLAGAERLLRGKKIHIAETGSPEEIDKWVADHDGTTEIDSESIKGDWERVLGDIDEALRTGREPEDVQDERHARERKERGLD